MASSAPTTDVVSIAQAIFNDLVDHTTLKSPESMASIASIDDNVAALDEIFRILEMKLQGHRAFLRKKRNALLPISKLPPELLAEIIITNNPRLWSFVHSKDPVELMLQRVKDARLRVSCYGVRTSSHLDAKFVDLVTLQRSRWAALAYSSVYSPTSFPALSTALNEELPLLLALHLAVRGPTDLVLDPGRLPRLRHLSLRGIYRLPLRPFSNLVSLAIVEWQSVAESWVMETLAFCPDLTSLSLSEIFRSRAPEIGTLRRVGPVVLSKLEDLNLDVVPTDFAAEILRHIRPKALMKMKIKGIADPRGDLLTAMLKDNELITRSSFLEVALGTPSLQRILLRATKSSLQVFGIGDLTNSPNLSLDFADRERVPLSARRILTRLSILPVPIELAIDLDILTQHHELFGSLPGSVQVRMLLDRNFPDPDAIGVV
ncbi:hypothetical protein FRB99_008493 [Tulasnella sp. 403]|nr:hypothetical protein FRB99_008493 [Tulasnella sp. 403]